MKNIIPVILAGGFSRRLHPITSTHNPKQFNTIINNPPLFEIAMNLIDGSMFPPIIIGNAIHKHLIQKYSPRCNAIILEPAPKNTLASILLASLYVEKVHGGNTQMLIIPSDHLIADKQKFLESVNSATGNKITLFGVKPIYPSTQYGYLHTTKEGGEMFTQKFIEKPSQAVANQFLKDNNFYWNSGIFMFEAEYYSSLCKKFIPQTYSIVQKLFDKTSIDGKAITIGGDFHNIENISVDYAILEKLHNIPTVEMLSAWSDIGSFASLYTEKAKHSIVTVQRPWGHYGILEEGDGYKLKKLIINPKQSLSLQSHEFRSEHWTVITGTAQVINGNENIVLHTGESAFIPPQTQHKLSNKTNEKLEIFEIQIGEHLSEDDITRYDAPPPRLRAQTSPRPLP